MFNSKRYQSLSKQQRHLTLAIDRRYIGWYRAPNGKRYFGRGRVVEMGTTHDGSIYASVHPESYPHPGRNLEFFDPVTDQDMPLDQYPRDEAHRMRRLRRLQDSPSSSRNMALASGKEPGLLPGTTTYGVYISARNLFHLGPGRIVGPCVSSRDNDQRFTGFYNVDPVRDVRGVLPVWEHTSQDDIAPADIPRSPYSGSAQTQATHDPLRPRHTKKWGAEFWRGVLPPMPSGRSSAPALGSEHAGAYFAPDGQWFAGVGTVVAVGFATTLAGAREWYVFVEPVEGKMGRGDYYDFCHLVTCEWMDMLPSNPVPGTQCSPRQRKTLPARWRNLPPIHERPEIGQESQGVFYPAEAPKRDVYIGVGEVVRTGLDSHNKIWVEVKPVAGKTGHEYKFFDPWSGVDMPEDYYPD